MTNLSKPSAHTPRGDLSAELVGRATSVHGNITPADVFSGKKSSVVIKRPADKGGDTVAQIWHMSPFGIEIVEQTDVSWDLGDTVQLAFSAGQQEMHYSGQIVSVRKGKGHRRLVGLRFHKEQRSPAIDTRQNTRWECDPIYQPTGAANNVLRFNDMIYFHIKNISRDGMLVHTSLRNKHLLPGTWLDTVVTFPCVGQANFRMRVNHVREISVGGSPFLAVGLDIKSNKARAMALCGQYLLQFGSFERQAPSMAELRKQGFFVQSSAKAIDFGYVRTQKEYEEVLDLRHRVFRSVIPEGAIVDPGGWTDVFDSRARILTGRYRGKIVASCRIVFHESSDTLENESLAKLPESLPPREYIVESGRVCTDPDFRGNDLLIGLFRFLFLTVVESGRKYILSNCTDNLLHLYERVGNLRTGAHFVHKTDGKKHHILLADVRRVLLGLDVSPLYWAALVYPLWPMVRDSAYDEANYSERMRLEAYHLFSRGADRLLQFKLNRPRKAKKKPPVHVNKIEKNPSRI
jgi:predicted GNAT family N-acyltransferase